MEIGSFPINPHLLIILCQNGGTKAVQKGNIVQTKHLGNLCKVKKKQLQSISDRRDESGYANVRKHDLSMKYF